MEWNDITDKRDFAEFIDVQYRHLTYLIYFRKIENLYTSFEIPKKSGGTRLINSPKSELKSVQKRIAKKLEEYFFDLESQGLVSTKLSHGFTKSKSIITNSESHRNKRILLNIDIENFFPSFHFGRVVGFFEKNKHLKLPREVAIFISQLVCYDGSLPQGSPSSPIITNLICQILDFRISKLAKSFSLSYSRYADDMTFSTNDEKFFDRFEDFLREISRVIKQAGFELNKEKTRLQTRQSKQLVTGLVVNKKINVQRKFYKDSRAMAYNLYKKGEFFIEGEKGSKKQLLGRFNFIDQLEKYNNRIQEEARLKNDYIYQQKNLLITQNEFRSDLDYLNKLTAKEREYRKLLFYYHFFDTEYPVIVTEGKTDSRYIKAALKKHYSQYPNLVSRNDSGQFRFHLTFLRRTPLLKYYFRFFKDGADQMKNLSNFWTGEENHKIFPNYSKYFKNLTGRDAACPVIFLFDNELSFQKNKRPISEFIKHIFPNDSDRNQVVSELSQENKYNIIDNLYLLTHPSETQKEEIEDLFEENILHHKIDGRSFSKKSNFNKSEYYGKNEFSNYVLSNYKNINFQKFIPMLDNLNKLIEDYKSNR